MTRLAWLSKHATPVARDGAFHWFPADDDRELRTRLVERMRGIEPPAALFELTAHRVAWALVFTATAPTDQRSYSGLALAIAEATPLDGAALLAALDVPIAAPRAGIRDPEVEAEAGEVAGALGGAAIALLGDGNLRVGDPTAPSVPRAVGRVLAALPRATHARTIVGTVRRGAPATATGLAAVLARAVDEPGSREARAWAMCRELADARGTEARVAEPPAGDPIAALHAWGRGRSRATADALADALADRVLAVALAGGDPAAPIGEARWAALLPAARRTELLAALAMRGASWRALIETHLA